MSKLFLVFLTLWVGLFTGVFLPASVLASSPPVINGRAGITQSCCAPNNNKTSTAQEEHVTKLLTLIEQKAAEFSSIRRHLHQIPELGYEEQETSAFVRKKLIEFGI